ncbi:MAG: hypothetical protein WD470_12660 [Rhodospirillaceae bacterium]
MIIFNPWFVFIWILSSWVIGLMGRNKRYGFAGNFLISFLFSPLVGIVVLLASDGRIATTRGYRRARRPSPGEK